jgi:diguanylate cyclase (GGDEF)-like protein
MAYSAGIMFGGAGLLNLLEALVPGGPQIPLAPGLLALVFALVLCLCGPRLPTLATAALGPIGATMIAYALSSGGTPGDGAVLYMWPVLWQAYFFGRRATVLIVLWIGLVQALSLLSMPAGVGYLDRWLDVFVSVALVGGVIELLSLRNQELVARLANEARVDKLTGLLNRRGFEERAEVELSRARREQTSVGIASFDLDDFKGVNDEFGHGAGDRALTRTGAAFRAEMRDTDVLARIGGEEFVALLPGGRIIDARAFAERVRASLETVDDPSIPSVTISAGVTAAVAPDDLEPLLGIADGALYAAKLSGRNQTVARLPGLKSPPTLSMDP